MILRCYVLLSCYYSRCLQNGREIWAIWNERGKRTFIFLNVKLLNLISAVRFHFVADSVKSGISCEILLGLQHTSLKSHHWWYLSTFWCSFSIHFYFYDINKVDHFACFVSIHRCPEWERDKNSFIFYGTCKWIFIGLWANLFMYI